MKSPVIATPSPTIEQLAMGNKPSAHEVIDEMDLETYQSQHRKTGGGIDENNSGSTLTGGELNIFSNRSRTHTHIHFTSISRCKARDVVPSRVRRFASD